MGPASSDQVLAKFNEDCKNTVSAFKKELHKVRTGRASSGIVETVMVDYYGAKTQLSHLAQITTPEPRLIMIQVHDASAVSSIEKALKSSGLGFNPAREGNVLRVTVPALTEETRREIIKHLHKMTEDMRISVRNHRRDANEVLKTLEKDGTITKDDCKKSTEKVQKQTEVYVADLDKALAAKELEVKEV